MTSCDYKKAAMPHLKPLTQLKIKSQYRDRSLYPTLGIYQDGLDSSIFRDGMKQCIDNSVDNEEIELCCDEICYLNEKEIDKFFKEISEEANRMSCTKSAFASMSILKI